MDGDPALAVILSLKSNESFGNTDEGKSNLEEIPKRNSETCWNGISHEDLFAILKIVEITTGSKSSSSNINFPGNSESNFLDN